MRVLLVDGHSHEADGLGEARDDEPAAMHRSSGDGGGVAGEVRVAFAIGHRVGTAVQRNLLRRRLQHILAAHAECMPPGSYLFRPDPSARDLTFKELSTIVSDLLQTVRERA